jgi:hypothetical protein
MISYCVRGAIKTMRTENVSSHCEKASLAASLSGAIVALVGDILSLHLVLDILEGKVTEAVRLVAFTAQRWRK